jgi:hypothetical protein
MLEGIFQPDRTLLLYVLNSLALAAVLLVARALVVRAVLRSQTLTAEGRRRWVVSLRYATALIFLVGLIFIWAAEIRTFAVSLVAIALAVVVATKELIQCVGGSILRVGANAYTVGDRIQIAGLRGNVLDQGLLATTILEIGPGQLSHQYTGRAVVFPNSLLLNTPLINETHTKEYIVQVLTIPLRIEDDWATAERILLEAAAAECTPFLEEAKRHMKHLEGRAWLDAPSVEPRVTVRLPEPGRIDLLLRIPAPASLPARLEQAILRRFLAEFPAVRAGGGEPRTGLGG